MKFTFKRTVHEFDSVDGDELTVVAPDGFLIVSRVYVPVEITKPNSHGVTFHRPAMGA